MGQYIGKRLLQTIPVLILVSVLVFAMIRAIPGDPAVVLLGPNASADQIARLRIQMGLDQPVYTQYLIWLGNLARGDMGESFLNGFPVSDLISQKLPATIQLASAALLSAIVISIPLGALAAMKRGSWLDHLISVYTSLGLGVPNFWLAMLLVLLFSLTLKLLPPSGYVSITENPVAGLKAIILPTVTEALYLSAIFTRFVRSSMLETMQQEYVRTAYAKGLARSSVVWRHILKNALIPVVTVFGIQFGGLLGGTVIVESIFNWPGVGRLLITSILSRDYSVVQAVTLMAVVVYMLVNLATDLVYGVLDPRIRAQ